LERPTRSRQPTCLHYSLDKKFFELQYPNHFYCGHCEDYVEARILDASKNLKRDYRHFICQGGYKSFISPSTLKIEKIKRVLFKTVPVPGDDDTESNDSNEVALPSARAIASKTTTPHARAISTSLVTPAQPTPPPNENPLAPTLRNLQANYDMLSGVSSRATADYDLLKACNTTLLYQVRDDKKILQDLQARNAELSVRHQSMFLKAGNPNDLVAQAINLPFDNVLEFDGSGMVSSAGEKTKNQVTQFVSLFLIQSAFFGGLLWNEILKQAKTFFGRRSTLRGRSPGVWTSMEARLVSNPSTYFVPSRRTTRST
jgi:hypothetical protein